MNLKKIKDNRVKTVKRVKDAQTQSPKDFNQKNLFKVLREDLKKRLSGTEPLRWWGEDVPLFVACGPINKLIEHLEWSGYADQVEIEEEFDMSWSELKDLTNDEQLEIVKKLLGFGEGEYFYFIYNDEEVEFTGECCDVEGVLNALVNEEQVNYDVYEILFNAGADMSKFKYVNTVEPDGEEFTYEKLTKSQWEEIDDKFQERL